MQKSRVYFAMLIAILAVSTASIFIRQAQQDAPSIVIAAVRLSLASLVLAPFALHKYRGEIRSLTRRDWILATISGLFLSIHFATWITSLEFTSVVSSVVLVSTGPLWVALLSPIFLREIPSRWAWIGMGFALLGGIIVSLGGSCAISSSQLACPPLIGGEADSTLLGNFLALLGAWAVAVYLMIGRNLRARINLIPYIFIVYSIAAITLNIYMLATGESPIGYPPTTYLWMICLALLPQLIGHSSYNWALRYMPASLVAVTTLGEPIGSTILAFILLRESPSVITLVGGVLILIGIYMSTLTPSVNKR
jgi:drug/metabolite transporter (DMT)-like permease